MYCDVDGRFVMLREDSGKLHRKFAMSRGMVRSAYVSGDGPTAHVSITLDTGKTEVYDATGRLIRR